MAEIKKKRGRPRKEKDEKMVLKRLMKNQLVVL